MTAAPTAPPSPTTNLDHALAFARRGWRVVPVPPGRKVPTITAWQREGTTDERRIRHWWTQAPDHGIGIVTGPASGIWVLDIDVAGGKAGDETLAELEAAYGPLPATYEVITGSGGRHLYFAWPGDGTDIRNNQSGRVGSGLDVRAEGGFVVAPPSLHASGNRYEVEAGAPDHAAPAPAWLLGLLAPDEPDHERTSPAPVRTDRPGDAWAAATSWDQLLTGDGWTKLRPGPDGEDRWVRPGKDPREGPSATVGYGGSDVLKVFTSSHPSLRAEETYTKLGYEAAVRHGGDHSAAARWCRQQGHGDVRDLVGDAPVAAAPAPRPASTAPWPDPEPWSPELELPPFPVEVLPDWVREHALAAADARQVPVDMTAMLAIGALSAACTGRAVVWPNTGWSEPVNLYLVVAMRSGAGKSPAEKAMAGWLRRWERDRMAAMGPAHDEAVILGKLADKKYRKLTDGALADGGDVIEAARAAQAARDAVPALPRLIIDDTTPEAVATLLAAHGERLAILSTEADLFDSLMKGNSSQRSSMVVYLKAWSGDELRRDRKGGSESGPESTVLEHPLLSVSVTVQPSVLARMLTDEEMANRGFAARFMFAMPADLMGRRDQRRRFRSGDMATAGAYEAKAKELATRWSRWARPADIHMSTEAASMFEEFLVELEPALAQGAELEVLAEWVAKMVASTARYAGLLHLAEEQDHASELDGATMERAITLGRYWLAHAIGVKGAGEDQVTRQAKLILEWIAEQGVGQVRPADIQKGLRRPGEGLNLAADYIPALVLLVEHGWLRYEGDGDWRADIGVKRAPSPALHVLPDVVGNPRFAAYPRKPRTASMGERESLPSSTPSLNATPTPQSHAVRGLRGLADPPSDPLDWSSWADDTQEPTP